MFGRRKRKRHTEAPFKSVPPVPGGPHPGSIKPPMSVRPPVPPRGTQGGQVEPPEAVQPPMRQDPHYSPHAAPTPCCWVPIFVDWAEGRTPTLDFAGHEVPERVQQVLEASLGKPRG